jgi:hypothetical protein
VHTKGTRLHAIQIFALCRCTVHGSITADLCQMQADEEFDCVAESASQDDDQDRANGDDSEPAEEHPTAPEPVRGGPDWCFGSGSFQSAIPPACLEGAGGGVILGNKQHMISSFAL